MSIDPVVVCADVGSTTAKKFGWWSSACASGTSPTALSEHVAHQLNAGRAVALGFECPLFVPLMADELSLTAARPGEGNRSWSAAAGLGAMGVGLAQVPWVLRTIKAGLTAAQPCFVDWEAFQRAASGLLVWEAFVSGGGKAATHIRDAEAGAKAFLSALPEPPKANKVKATTEVFSLVGAALLRTGWSNDVELLRTPVLVIGPTQRGA